MKGNYKYMLITSRKKYSTVDWDGDVETKGMTPVKRDTLPVAKYVTSNVLAMINSDHTYEEKKRNITELLGRVMTAINNGKIPPTQQMTETKINCQPHYIGRLDHSRAHAHNVRQHRTLIDIHIRSHVRRAKGRTAFGAPFPLSADFTQPIHGTNCAYETKDISSRISYEDDSIVPAAIAFPVGLLRAATIQRRVVINANRLIYPSLVY